jgi:hypothetical protein
VVVRVLCSTNLNKQCVPETFSIARYRAYSILFHQYMRRGGARAGAGLSGSPGGGPDRVGRPGGSKIRGGAQVAGQQARGEEHGRQEG